MESLISLTRSARLAIQRRQPHPTTPRQLGLVLDDARLQGLTPTDRQAALLSLVHLLLEAVRATACAVTYVPSATTETARVFEPSLPAGQKPQSPYSKP